MSNTITGTLVFLVVLGIIFMGFLYTIPNTDWYSNLPENTELNYTGNISNIEFLGGGLVGLPQTLIRFDSGDTLLFRYHEADIPLNKEVMFYYHDNGFGYLFLDEFEVIK